MDSYFFDSYAIMEIVKENPDYSNYADSNIVLTKLNIFEIFYNILIQQGEEKASEIVEEIFPYAIDFTLEDIKEAAKMKLKFKERKLSMTDCIGYILAKRIGTKFLTGDKEFKDLDNVEFVK